MKPRSLGLFLSLSGAGALILEVTWFRRLAQIVGGTSLAMGAVLAAVIGGMALGAWWIGSAGDRVRRPLRFYGWLECGIAVCALFAPALLAASEGIFDGLQFALGKSPLLLSAARFCLATLLLALPAILMGGSLPAIACALDTQPTGRGRALGWLYAANTLGAVVGTLLAGFVLLPRFGLALSMRLAAVFSGSAGIAALLLPGTPTRNAPQAPDPAPEPGARRAILLYAASGFLGLVAEVAFTRHLVLVFGSTTFAFTTTLAVFLLGIGLGGALGAALTRRSRDPLRLLESTIAWTAALLSLSTLLVYALPRLYLEAVLGWAGGFESGLVLRFLLAAMVLLPGALGLGAAFAPAAQLASSRAMGAGIGKLYAANTLASVAGSLAAVFFLVPLFSPQQAVAAAALVAGGVVCLRARRPLTLLLLAGAALGLLPPPEVARERLLAGVFFVPTAFATEDGRIDERSWSEGVDIPWSAYGRDATVAIWSWYGTQSLLIDGKAVASNQIVADRDHLSLLGHLPMALHADPQRVLVVGLGMGITYKAVAEHHPRLLRVVEIEPAVAQAAAHLGIVPGDLVIADARSYLRATRERFDVITSDPIHPWVRGGGDLYTIEYFRSVARHLARGGVACQWLPLSQMGIADLRYVLRTFAAAFADAGAYYAGGDLVLAGTAQGPLRKGPFARQKVLDRAGMGRAAGPGELLTDDTLRLEFSTPRQIDNHAFADCVAWLQRTWKDPPPAMASMLAAREARWRGDSARMWQMLSAAREQAPENRSIIRYIGELYLLGAGSDIRAGRKEEALYDLIRAKRFLPGDVRLLGVEADLRELLGQRDRARALFEKLLAREPESRYLRRRLRALK